MSTTSHASTTTQDTDPEAVKFALRCIKSWGLDVRYSDSLASPYGADRDTGTIWLPTGLPWSQAHARVNRAWLYMLGGRRWAREFAPNPMPASGEATAKVIPMIRKPW